ncbi:MAG: glycosyltransferase family 39 protein [Bacteroidales bacterium]|nr:glycosyltransferase family 39 protein [Bacteroidales bacterium]
MHFLKAKIFKPELIFLGFLIACGLLYDYHHIVFYKPVGIHQWRNCVSAAFPVNYSFGGSFLTTQTNAMLAENATSDITVVEFPLIYYIVSLFYRIFGVHEFWFRMFQVVIGFIGLVYLFKASYYFTRDWFYAGVIPLIIFTSPIYVFYLNNFIPDAAALSLTFAGFYFFMKYTSARRFRIWLLSMLFFLLAGLTKTSSLLPYLGLGGVAIIDLILRRKRSGEEPLFQFEFKYIASFIGVAVLIFGWYLYARIYSDAHRGSVSAVEIRPIWKLTGETIQSTLASMKLRFRKGDYHATFFLFLSVVVFLSTLIFYKKANRFLYRLNILVILGAVSFTLLFFRSMRNHDYYQINNLFIFVIIYLAFFSIFSKAFPRVYNSIWARLPFVLLVVFLVINCRNRVQFRYSEDDAHYLSSMKVIEMFDIEDYLREIGIERTDKVYCTPDPSPNISLYLCDQKGRTDFGRVSRWTMEKRLEYMKGIQIEYVILGSREKYEDVENLDELLGEKIGQIDGTEIFKLGDPDHGD